VNKRALKRLILDGNTRARLLESYGLIGAVFFI